MAQTNPDVSARSSNNKQFQTGIGIPAVLENVTITGPVVMTNAAGAAYTIGTSATVAQLMALLQTMGLITTFDD